ncbi:hypothetical protein DFJ73DRAFT_807200 [Zopfochytrium polystomum]|nr:hypothetical protein DFJ73DRAFT_807200 [Zopfochytrium polystomum]
MAVDGLTGFLLLHTAVGFKTSVEVALISFVSLVQPKAYEIIIPELTARRARWRSSFEWKRFYFAFALWLTAAAGHIFFAKPSEPRGIWKEFSSHGVIQLNETVNYYDTANSSAVVPKSLYRSLHIDNSFPFDGFSGWCNSSKPQTTLLDGSAGTTLGCWVEVPNLRGPFTSYFMTIESFLIFILMQPLPESLSNSPDSGFVTLSRLSALTILHSLKLLQLWQWRTSEPAIEVRFAWCPTESVEQCKPLKVGEFNLR